MVTFFKRHIVDWTDATEGLSHQEYRVYDTVLNLIYANEGPVRNNERAIAARCNMHVNAYRCALSLLIQRGYLTDTDGRLGQHRAETELRLIEDNRDKAARGGRQKAANALKDKDADLASVEDTSSYKTRQDKTREDKKGASAPTPRSALLSVLDAEHAEAVIEHRQKFRKPLTARAARMLAKELGQHPDPNAAADYMILKGWMTFDPNWSSAKPRWQQRQQQQTSAEDVVDQFGQPYECVNG